MSSDLATVIVCGLSREATLAKGPGIVTVAGGGNRAALEARLAALDAGATRIVVSFGLAGALTPDLAVGSVLLPAEGPAGDGRDVSLRFVQMVATGTG